jgi:serine/threonine protein kinase
MNYNFNEIGIIENNILRKLQKKESNSLVKLFSSFYFQKHFCLVFELLDGNLLDFNKILPKYNKINLNQMRKLIIQMLTSLHFLHENQFIHSDLKPENILIKDSKYVKLIDFGNTIHLNQVELYLKEFRIQSLFYRSPEVVFGVKFDQKIDMWSLGVLIVELCVGIPLFHSKTNSELIVQIFNFLGSPLDDYFKNGKFYHLYKNSISSNSKKSDNYIRLSHLLKVNDFQFISFLLGNPIESSKHWIGLLELNPNHRMSARDSMLHPFMEKLFPFQIFSKIQTKKRLESTLDLLPSKKLKM